MGVRLNILVGGKNGEEPGREHQKKDARGNREGEDLETGSEKGNVGRRRRMERRIKREHDRGEQK